MKQQMIGNKTKIILTSSIGILAILCYVISGIELSVIYLLSLIAGELQYKNYIKSGKN